jgi:hypothetical protein
MVYQPWLRWLAAAVFILEGLAILFRPEWSITAFARKYRVLQYVASVLLDCHWDGRI